MIATPSMIATRLERLIQVVHPRERGPYSNSEIAAGISQGATFLGGRRRPYGLAEADIAALRAGRPILGAEPEYLEAIADYFGVSPAYFTFDEEAVQIDQQLGLLGRIRDGGLTGMGPCTVEEMSAEHAAIPGAIRAEAEHGKRPDDG